MIRSFPHHPRRGLSTFRTPRQSSAGPLKAAERSLGITRQKAGYFVNVAEAVRDGELQFRALGKLDDQAAMDRLTSIKGVGPWTARVYLLMALRRPDIWPTGDIALATAYGRLKSLSKRPTSEELAELASFIMSDGADWMRGEVVTFDGGEWMRNAGEFNFMLDIDIPWDQMLARKGGK